MVDIADRRAERAHRVDGKAIVSAVLAIAAVLTAHVWVIATLLSAAAVALALASRRSLRADPELGGTALSLAGFLLASGVLVFATIGPIVLSTVLMLSGALRA